MDIISEEKDSVLNLDSKELAERLVFISVRMVLSLQKMFS